LNKHFSRRRFLALAGFGAAGAAISADPVHPRVRFFRERLAELVKPALGVKQKPDPSIWDDRKITATWLGHATVLINFCGIKIITDPVLFSRVGASLGVGTLGPLRRQACALASRELPEIDLALVSHAHLDHLDLRSLNALRGKPALVTARNTRDLFRETRIKSPVELGWGERSIIETKHGEVEVQAFEVRHWGARWRHDTQRGYNGYVLRRGNRQIIFGGDTARCDGFKAIHRNGGYELACMPIGAYNPFIHSHCNPEEALAMANEAGADRIMPVHFYTFRFGRELCTEPLERLESALGSHTDRLGWREAGQTFSA
jgi:L-ascorbate metabolism protein UlaG (beta-lactamase superfamily)